MLLVFLALAGWVYYQATNPSQSPAGDATSSSTDASQEAASSDSTSEQSPAASTADDDRPPFVTTPADLYRAYSTNEVATDQALAGKVIQFTAPVKSIDKDFTDSAVLRFSTGDDFSDLQATLKDSDKAAAAQLSPGEVVTVSCDSFKRIVDSPMGSDCTFLIGDTSSNDRSQTVVPQSATTNQTTAPSVAASTSPAVAPAATAAMSVPDQDRAGTPAASTVQAAAGAPGEPASSFAPPASGASIPEVLQAVIAKTTGPSFDCSKATSSAALAICSNADLSALDRQMAIEYYSHTNYATDENVRNAQRAWIRARNSCQTDAACLRQAYSLRIQQLQQ